MDNTLEDIHKFVGMMSSDPNHEETWRQSSIGTFPIISINTSQPLSQYRAGQMNVKVLNSLIQKTA